VRKLGVTTIIDTDGEPLRHAVRSEPEVVSPNELEAEELVGHEFNDADDRASAVAEMVRLGPREAIMTVPDGCFAQVLDESGLPALYRVSVEPLEARSPIGSGDAFLAGYVAARYAGRPVVDCLRFGVACGAESTQHIGAGILEPVKWTGSSIPCAPKRLSLPRGSAETPQRPAFTVPWAAGCPAGALLKSKRPWLPPHRSFSGSL